MQIPDDTIVYAIGDIHGCPVLLRQILTWIESHEPGRHYSRKKIIVLGDMVDRGPDSAGVIECLLTNPPEGFELICLRGNHEDLMLRALHDGTYAPIWLQNGGGATLKSYGIDDLDRFLRAKPAAVRKQLSDSLPHAHQLFLSNLPLSHREGDYFFVHAGLRPGIDINHQSPEDMMWIREAFVRSAHDFGVTIVHGHTVFPVPSVRQNAIGIDIGSVLTGRLCCLALWSGNREFFMTV